MLENLPAELLVHLLKFAEYRDWVILSRVSKYFDENLSSNLLELKNIYKELVDKNSPQIVEACQNSPSVTQAVVMSRLLVKLDAEQLKTIACSSLIHAEVILKSRLIERNWSRPREKEILPRTLSAQKKKLPQRTYKDPFIDSMMFSLSVIEEGLEKRQNNPNARDELDEFIDNLLMYLKR